MPELRKNLSCENCIPIVHQLLPASKLINIINRQKLGRILSNIVESILSLFKSLVRPESSRRSNRVKAYLNAVQSRQASKNHLHLELTADWMPPILHISISPQNKKKAPQSLHTTHQKLIIFLISKTPWTEISDLGPVQKKKKIIGYVCNKKKILQWVLPFKKLIINTLPSKNARCFLKKNYVCYWIDVLDVYACLYSSPEISKIRNSFLDWQKHLKQETRGAVG